MFTIRAVAATRRGSSRNENQDRVLLRDRRAAVADGMGGHNAGGVAAQIAVDTLARLDAAVGSADLVRGFWMANHAIRDDARNNPERTSMGTTLVAIELIQGHGDPSLAVASVGDSRLYRLRDSAIWRVTIDHTWGAELSAARIDQPATCSNRHLLTRSLGSDDAVNVDVWELDVEPGDRFLLCTDGAWAPLDDDEIEALWQHVSDDRIGERLVDAAVAAGGRDDATVIAVALAPTASDRDGRRNWLDQGSAA